MIHTSTSTIWQRLLAIAEEHQDLVSFLGGVMGDLLAESGGGWGACWKCSDQGTVPNLTLLCAQEQTTPSWAIASPVDHNSPESPWQQFCGALVQEDPTHWEQQHFQETLRSGRSQHNQLLELPSAIESTPPLLWPQYHLGSGDHNALYFHCFPLVFRQQREGILVLITAQPLPEQTEVDLPFFCHHLALNLANFNPQPETQSRHDALLFKLANQIRNSFDLNTILNIAVTQIRVMLQVDHCYYLWCWSQEGDNYSLMVSHEDHGAQKPKTPLGNLPPDKLDLLGEKIQALESIKLEDVAAQRNIFPEDDGKQQQFSRFLQEFHTASLIMQPLRTRSEHLGAILCSNEHQSRIWTSADLELLQGVVDQLAIAIDQAELFAQARATALAAQTQAQRLQLTLQELKQAQTQLIQTEKMSSLGQMVAGIAHEINNPVNFITGNLNYTKEYIHDLLELVAAYQDHLGEKPAALEELEEEIELDFLIEDLPKILSSMQVGADRIREIVLSLRNFSRLDEADMKPVDIHEGIDSTLLILDSKLKRKSGRGEITVEKGYGTLPKVDCYPGQLNQVFMNVLANSIDALDQVPEPKITIVTELIDRGPDSQIVIRLQDNGDGMDDNTINHIFDPFFTTKAVGKGTGLGLSISYQIIVEKHGGTIECQSQLGEGTTFTISLPLSPRCQKDD